jgi:N-methylhydantoinase A
MRRTVFKGTRLAVDIGGTFTDVVLHAGAGQWTAKVLTTPRAPEQGVIQSISHILGQAGVAPAQLDLIILGTTLATNALIERKGAATALITTQGFRDVVEIAHEHRFAQYDIFLDKPEPLVPRHLRFGVAERINARGKVLLPLDESGLLQLLPQLREQRVESVAVAFLHSYANPQHELRVRALLQQHAPELWITLSAEVCPEVREYERTSTACANAYVQPIMAGYLRRLETQLRELEVQCPLYLMTSGGAITTLELGAEQPVRLVESGPAGGAVLARQVARQCAVPRALSFDMGGTTAKICFIDDFVPQISRSFEFGRVYRFLKGSGLPIRIPVIEMVEIGAGGGSIARIDELQRVAVGPDSAGSDPGPACYARGGADATVTDADAVLGRIDPSRFAAGSMGLDLKRAEQAVQAAVAAPLKLDATLGALAVSEIVEENMANAARVHAMELGKAVENYSIIAFGGAAPLHATRMARKLGIKSVIIPQGAGVGSALGFLWAPVAFQSVRSWYQRIDRLDVAAANALLAQMRRSALDVVGSAAPGVATTEERVAFMRYVGQGHEIPVTLPARRLAAADCARLHAAFERNYRSLYGRAIPHLHVEVLSWTLTVSSRTEGSSRASRASTKYQPQASGSRRVFDPVLQAYRQIAMYDRGTLAAGARIAGPALIVEDQTTTVVSADFDAQVNSHGHLLLERRARRARR